MLPLFNLLFLVIVHASPVSDKQFKFADFTGDFLSDPRERDLLISKVDRLWPLEDYWNHDAISGLCRHAREKRNPSSLKWFLKKGLQTVCPPDPPNLIFKVIFESILTIDDIEIVRDLFPIAKELSNRCSVANNLYLYPQTAETKFQALMPLNSYSGSLPGFEPGFDHLLTEEKHVSAEEADAAYRRLLKALEAEKKYTEKWKDEVLSLLKLISSADEKQSMIDDIAREIDSRRFRDEFPEAFEFFFGSETWIMKLKADIAYCTDNPSHGFNDLFSLFFPAENHPAYDNMARLALDMVNAQSIWKWNPERLRILLEFGVLKDLMRDDSDYHILETSLTGPIWERVRPLVQVEFFNKNKLWLARSLSYFASLDAVLVREICSYTWEIRRNFPADILDFLLSLATQSQKHGSNDNMSSEQSLVDGMDNHQKRELSNFLFFNPHFGRLFFDNLLRIKYMRLSRGGLARVTFDRFTQSFLATSSRGIPTQERIKELMADRDQPIAGGYLADDQMLKDSEVNFVHGRTAYLNEHGKAIKFEKKYKSELSDEMKMDLFLQRHHCDLRLSSNLPVNPVVLCGVKLDRTLVNRLRPASADYKLHKKGEGIYRGLKFDVPYGYQIPLHQQISIRGLVSASKKTLRDAAILAKNFGLVSVAPADLFHNLEDQRRYEWNIDMQDKYSGERGAGRLDQWRKAIRHVNMGRTGIRDLKHFKFIDELKQMPQLPRIGTLLTHLGNFLFSWMLSVGEWFMTHEFNVKNLQDVVSQGLSIFMSAFTDKPFEECANFVNTALRLDRLARQMEYFMTKEYVDDLNNILPFLGIKYFATKKFRGGPKIPEEIYGEGVDIEVEKPLRYWNEREGWMRHEGEEDLGPYNGPFPITEMIRTLHIVLTTTLNLV